MPMPTVRALLPYRKKTVELHEAGLGDVRAQTAPEEAALQEARERRDTTRAVAEAFEGIRHSFASGSLAHGTANCPIHQRDKGLDADTGVVLGRRSQSKQIKDDTAAAVVSRGAGHPNVWRHGCGCG